MAKIDTTIFRNWNNGDTMREADYEREREIIRTAINDTDDRITNHKDEAELGHPDKSVTERKLGDLSVSRRTIQPGAVGSNELDDALLEFYGDIAVKAKLDTHDSQLAEKVQKTEVSLSYDFFEKKVELSGVQDSPLVSDLSKLKNDDALYKAITEDFVTDNPLISMVNNVVDETTGVHKAFTTVIEVGGTIYVFYRTATSHNSYDGKIVYKKSTDSGKTWSAEIIVIQDAVKDYRDPNIVSFSGKYFLKYFYRMSSGEIKTQLISTIDFLTWSSPVTLPDSPAGSANNASCGNMTVYNSELYIIAYDPLSTSFGSTFTYLVKTSDGLTFTIVKDVLSKNTNESSVASYNGKLYALLRQHRNPDKTNLPILFGVSSDGLTWDFKETSLKGQCPSLKVIGSKFIAVWRDGFDSLSSRYVTRLATLGVNGHLLSSSLEIASGTIYDMTYADILVRTSDVLVSHYIYDSTGKSKITLSSIKRAEIDFEKPNVTRIKKYKYLTQLPGETTPAVTSHSNAREIIGSAKFQGGGTAFQDVTIYFDKPITVYFFVASILIGTTSWYPTYQVKSKTSTSITLTIADAKNGTIPTSHTIELLWKVEGIPV